ncbi:hypothetical protein [Microbacterium panaciterrae]|uniref:Uncharacterized protein n=1 Tax=Microbacterium panaciterrae TaxID=985759 RepID=A0ABP8P9D3_9MICO
MSAAQDRMRNAFGQLLGRTTQHSDACPDCDADLRMVEQYEGVFVMTVLHDATCPAYGGAS